MKKKIKVGFLGFWSGFNIQDNVFINLLKYYYDVELATDILDNTLDLLIYSCFYKSVQEYEFLRKTKCKKLYYSGENDFPDLNIADYAMSQNRFVLGNRHMYCPLWFRQYLEFKDGKLYPNILTEGSSNNELANREFCSFVVSNNNCAIPLRTKIFEKLSEYKSVASGGKYLNNIGGPVDDKNEFLKKYKFNIASENSITPGYITEKIVDAFNAETIPIYVGAPDVINEINSKAFVNVNDFSSFDDLMNRIKELDTNDDLYMQMLKEPKFNNGVIEKLQEDFTKFLINVVEGPKFNHKYGRVGLMLYRN